MPKDHIPGSSYIGSGGCPKLTHGLRSFEFKRVSKKTSSLADLLSATESGLQQCSWTTKDVKCSECRRPCQKTPPFAVPTSVQEAVVKRPSSRGRPKPVDCGNLSAKSEQKYSILGRPFIGYRRPLTNPWTTEDMQWFECRRPCQKTSSLADSQIRGLRKMCDGLNAEDRAKRHHPWQTPRSVDYDVLSAKGCTKRQDP